MRLQRFSSVPERPFAPVRRTPSRPRVRPAAGPRHGATAEILSRTSTSISRAGASSFVSHFNSVLIFAVLGPGRMDLKSEITALNRAQPHPHLMDGIFGIEDRTPSAFEEKCRSVE